MILIAVIVLSWIGIRELPSLFHYGRTREFAVFVILTAINLTLALLVLLDVKIITPQKVINEFMAYVVNLFSRSA